MRTRPRALFPGRFQPWHAGHTAIVQTLIGRGFHVTILHRGPFRGVLGGDNPFGFPEVQRMIIDNLHTAGVNRDLYHTCHVEFEALAHGRDVGFEILDVPLDASLEEIRGRDLR